MAWNKGLPDDSGTIRNGPSEIRANWDEIEENDTGVLANSLNQWAVHLLDRREASVTGADTPAAIDEVGMLYCRNNGEGSARDLYYRNQDADIQITRNAVVSDAANGLTFLPGGLVMQWFKETAIPNAAVTAVTFPTAFASSIYNIQITVLGGDAEDVNGPLYLADTTPPTITGFNVRNRTGKAVDIYVMAIGK